MTLNSILLQDAAGGAGLMNILMIVALIVILYLVKIRPQQNKQNAIKKLLE